MNVYFSIILHSAYTELSLALYESQKKTAINSLYSINWLVL